MVRHVARQKAALDVPGGPQFLLQAFLLLKFSVKPGVLNRNRCLGGERVEQLQSIWPKGIGREGVLQVEDPHQLPSVDKRQAED